MCDVGVVGEPGLGHLDPKTARSDAGLSQVPQHAACKARRLQLPGADVHPDPEVGRPGPECSLYAGFREDVLH